MTPLRHKLRVVALACVSAGAALLLAPSAAQAARERLGVQPSVSRVNDHWLSCNQSGVDMAPLVLWTRIKQAVSTHSDIPRSFWTTAAMRRDIVKVVCYESSFNYRAANGPQYGWFQMSHTNIQSEGVTWTQYWDGDSHGGAGWYQCTAGERYILHRYGSPAGAWAHEANYGWY